MLLLPTILRIPSISLNTIVHKRFEVTSSHERVKLDGFSIERALKSLVSLRDREEHSVTTR